MPFSGFWCALADTTLGTRIVGSEVQLSPAPTTVEYPSEFLGQILETADGNAIQQQPTKDPRRRTWVWANYPYYMPSYQRLWATLNTLRSRYRQALALSPYVFLLDTVSGQFANKGTYVGTVGSASTTGFTPAVATYALDQFKGAEVVFTTGGSAGVRAYITGNAANGLITFDAPLGSTPSGGFAITYFTADWTRCRVVDVNRANTESGIVRYSTTKLVFVIDDPAWDGIG